MERPGHWLHLLSGFITRLRSSCWALKRRASMLRSAREKKPRRKGDRPEVRSALSRVKKGLKIASYCDIISFLRKKLDKCLGNLPQFLIFVLNLDALFRYLQLTGLIRQRLAPDMPSRDHSL